MTAGLAADSFINVAGLGVLVRHWISWNGLMIWLASTVWHEIRHLDRAGNGNEDMPAPGASASRLGFDDVGNMKPCRSRNQLVLDMSRSEDHGHATTYSDLIAVVPKMAPTLSMQMERTALVSRITISAVLPISTDTPGRGLTAVLGTMTWDGGRLRRHFQYPFE